MQQRHAGRLAVSLGAALAVLALAGCAGWQGASGGRAPAEPVILSGTCDARAVDYAIGRRATQALQNEVITKSLAKTIRVLRPGEATTQEFSSQRLNLQTDSAGVVTAITCG